MPRDPLIGVSEDPMALMIEVGRSYWRHAGFAGKADFAQWAGVPQRDARTVVLALKLTRVTVDGFGDEVYALPEVLDTARCALVPLGAAKPVCGSGTRRETGR
ncbi:MAG: hypothetical protein EXR69_07940 [Myxococcales bacterium]|nr:hypothetical protein [Myxococcales bacterium]